MAGLVLGTSNTSVRAVDCENGGTVWTNEAGSWFDPGNWDIGVPGTNCAFINNDGEATIDSGDDTAFAFALYLAYSQEDSGSVVVDGGDLEIETSYPLPECPGTIYVGRKGTGNLTIENGGTVSSRFVYIGAETNPTQPNSNGTVTVENGASLLVKPGECEFATGGAMICIGCDANGNDGGTAVLDIKDGTVEVDNLGAGVLPPGVKVGPSGTVRGNSVLQLTGASSGAQTASVLGTLAPSGTLTIKGKLDLTNGGTSNSANIICHVTPTANDSVVVSNATGAGQVTLGGRITVIMSGAFSQGSTFTLLHADGGRLNNSTFAFTTIIDNGTGCYTPTIVYDDNNNNVNLYLAPRNRCN